MRPSTSTRVVVLGGGYAGTTAANHLRRRAGRDLAADLAADLDVVLVNPRPRFVERIRLHQLVADTHASTVGFDGLLDRDVRLVVDTATLIDAEAAEVLLASGDRLPYDHLVYAVGSTDPVPATVPGAVEHALTLGEYSSARRTRTVVDALAPLAPIVVVGGGLTGIETAAELAERGRAVHLVGGGTLGPSLAAPGRRAVARRLRRLDVDVRASALVVEVRPDAVVLADGTVLPAAATIWTAGFGVPELAARSGLTTDAVGRLVTDGTLTGVDDERIVGAGDAVAPAGRPLRMSCQAARPLGVQAAATVLDRIAGVAPSPAHVRFAGQCVSLGRGAGLFQTARLDDTPLDVVVAGRLGAVIKETICRSTVRGLRAAARRPGSARPAGGHGAPAVVDRR